MLPFTRLACAGGAHYGHVPIYSKITSIKKIKTKYEFEWDDEKQKQKQEKNPTNKQDASFPHSEETHVNHLCEFQITQGKYDKGF